MSALQPHLQLQDVTHYSNFLYSNVTGLRLCKLNEIIKYADQYSVKFFFVAEHWFMDWKNISSHPYFVASTPSSQLEQHSRPQGGVALFAHPNIQNRLKLISVHEAYLQISFDSLDVLAVYLPPKYSDVYVSQLLQQACTS